MKKILSILLAALLCVSLFAACGESKPAATETKTEAAAAIKIGGIGPLNGRQERRHHRRGGDQRPRRSAVRPAL